MEKRNVRLIGLIVVALLVFGPGIVSLLHMAWKRHVMDRKLRELETLHQELANERERLTSDPVYVEGLIRSTFKVAKPGELVVPLDSEESTKAR